MGTLTRFFALHFLLPFIIRGLSIVHLLFLHITGSSNPLGVNRNLDKTPFHPYFSVKDLVGILIFLLADTLNIGRPGKLYSCQSSSYSCSYSARMVFFVCLCDSPIGAK